MFKLVVAVIVLSASVACSGTLLDKLHDNEFISNLHSQVTSTGAKLDSKLNEAAGAQVDALHNSVGQVANQVSDKIGSVVTQEDASDIHDAVMSRTDDVYQTLFGDKKPAEPEDPVEGDFGLLRRKRSLKSKRRSHYDHRHQNVIYPTGNHYGVYGHQPHHVSQYGHQPYGLHQSHYNSPYSSYYGHESAPYYGHQSHYGSHNGLPSHFAGSSRYGRRNRMHLGSHHGSHGLEHGSHHGGHNLEHGLHHGGHNLEHSLEHDLHHGAHELDHGLHHNVHHGSHHHAGHHSGGAAATAVAGGASAAAAAGR